MLANVMRERYYLNSMLFKKTSFGGAEKIMKSKGTLLAEIEDILHQVNVVVTWHGQTRLNEEFDREFTSRGWMSQVDSLLKLESKRKRPGTKSIDYRHPNAKVDVEVEFGNVASFYRDIFKFNISKRAGQIDVGIIIAGNKKIANAVGENVASYERFQDEMSISRKYGASADCPVLLYGLIPKSFPDKKNLIDPNAAKLKKQLQSKRKSK